MLEGVEDTARWTRVGSLAIKELMNKTAETVRKRGAKDLFKRSYRGRSFISPTARSRFLEEMGIGNRQTASAYLRELEKIGVLRGVKKGREIYYLNGKFLDLLGEVGQKDRSGICSRNEPMPGICRKKQFFSTYLENMSKARTCGRVWLIPIFFTGLRATLCGAIPESRRYKPGACGRNCVDMELVKHSRSQRLIGYVQESRVFGHIPRTCPLLGHIDIA